MKIPSLALYALACASFAQAVKKAPVLEGYASTNGGTTGGGTTATKTVTTASQLTSAIAGDSPKVVRIQGIITSSSRFRPGSHTTIEGVGSTSGITGGGLSIVSVNNVIVRNLAFSKVTGNDAITIQNATNVWIDHNEFSSDLTHGPDYYDGAVDIIRASNFITVSWNYFHDHWKNSLVGNSPDLGSTDTGRLRVTYHHNYFNRVQTRAPAMRFGQAHVYNNYYNSILAQGIHTRSKGQALVEYNVFRNSTEAASSYGLVIPADSPNTSPEGDYEEDGFLNLRNNDLGGATVNVTAVGTFTSVPYSYSITPLASVISVVTAGAGVGKI